MMANCRKSCQSCQGGDRAWELRQHLAKKYDNITALPNSTLARIVRIESLRLTHLEIDEAKKTARIFGRMVLSWNDSKISWDKNSWGISWLNFYWIQIWTPQLIQINAPSFSPSIVTGKVLAANYTGQVFLWVDFNFLAPSTFSYSDYPNDVQRICAKFDDKRYFSVRFRVSDEIRTQKHEALSETHVSGWSIENMDLTDSKYVLQTLGNDWKQNPFDIQTNNCEICLELKRNAVYYISEMLLPMLVTTALTLSAALFQLSSIQSALLAFSIVTQILSMLLINSRLPSFTDTTPTILKYAGFNLFATAFLFLTSLILKNLSQSKTNIPLPRVVNNAIAFIEDKIPTIPKIQKTTNQQNDEETTTTEELNSGWGYYKDMAYSLHNIIFSLFFLIYSLLIIICFVF